MNAETRRAAALSAEVYQPLEEGARITREDATYKAVLVVSRPSGYQGMVFQHLRTRDFVVAHRGTELSSGLGPMLQDGVLTDGGMLAGRYNMQARDAMRTTAAALQLARVEGSPEGATPTVTTTGHSLGGTLAQITAHHFGLRGETFNAYGAASLGYRIPEGGDEVVNHVIATDPVSAASRHYGRVVVYARPRDIATLHGASYANDRNLLDPRSPLGSTLVSIGAHRMDYFLDVEGAAGHRSVLSDPGARRLAAQYAPMIDKYRGDVGAMRAAVTMLARGGPGNLRDGIRVALGPLPAGTVDTAKEGRHSAPRHPPPAGLLQAHPVADHAPFVPLQDLPGAPPRPAWLRAPVQVPLRAPAPGSEQGAAPAPDRDVSAWLDRILEAGRSGDAVAFRAHTLAAANADAGQALRSQAMAEADRQHALAMTAPAHAAAQGPTLDPAQASAGARATPAVLRLG